MRVVKEAKNWLDVNIRSMLMSNATHSIVVLVQVIGDNRFVPSQSFFKICKCIAGDAKRRRFNVMREFVEPAIVSNLSTVSQN